MKVSEVERWRGGGGIGGGREVEEGEVKGVRWRRDGGMEGERG